MYDAAEKYQEAGHPLLVLAGKEYGSGSSRDWAAKGPFLLVSVMHCHVLSNVIDCEVNVCKKKCQHLKKTKQNLVT